jgi:hypothetical protein
MYYKAFGLANQWERACKWTRGGRVRGAGVMGMRLRKRRHPLSPVVYLPDILTKKDGITIFRILKRDFIHNV